MKKVVLGAVAVAMAGLAVNSAKADNFYGKFDVRAGYELNGYAGEMKDEIDNAKNEGASVNSLTHSITLGVGYNLYYKLNDTVNPFVGLEIVGRMPVAGVNVISETNGKFKYKEYLNLHLRLGAKININKDLAVSPYGMIGAMVSNTKIQETETYYGMSYSFKADSYHLGLSTGVGADLIIKDRWLVGVKYRYTKSDMGTNGVTFKSGTHTFGVNLGVQF